MKKLNENEIFGSGIVPETRPQEPEEPQDKDLTDFYATCGLKGGKVNKIIKQLISYFEADRKNIIPGIVNKKEDEYMSYFLQYLGEYKSIMKDPEKAKRMYKLKDKQNKKQTTTEENKEISDWEKEIGMK